MHTPSIDFEKLKTFYVCAKTGKFSIAASKLGVDNSTVTRQIQNLEAELNCILFERGGFKGLRLTEKGKILYKLAHDLFVKIAQIDPSLEAADELLEGPLRVWVHNGYASTFITTYINEFTEEYPRVPIELISSFDPLDVTIREVDIGIFHNGISYNKKDLIEKEILWYDLKLYGTQKYFNKHGIPKNLNDLKNQNFVSASNYGKTFSKVNWYLELIPNSRINPYFVTNSLSAIETLIKKGTCIGSLSPQFLGENNSGLIPILPEISGPRLAIIMVYGEHFKNSKKVEAFYNFFLEKAQKLIEEKN